MNCPATKQFFRGREFSANFFLQFFCRTKKAPFICVRFTHSPSACKILCYSFMKSLFTLLLSLVIVTANAQLLSWSPAFIQESSSPIDIIMDANYGNQGLKNYTPTTDVYVHIGATTNLGNWQHVPFAWGTTNAAAQCTYLGNNKWKYTITGGLRSFFGITNASEYVTKISILFRNGAGSAVQRNSDGSDMFIPVYNSALHVRIDQPYRQPKYDPVPEPLIKNVGDQFAITANSSQAATLKLYLNGTQVGSTVTNGTTISANPTITSACGQTIIAEATVGTTTSRDTFTFFVAPSLIVAALPAGVRNGVNYEPGDTSVTLVLYAPHKTHVTVIGDFTNWAQQCNMQMKRTSDTTTYWLRITGLTPGTEYAYQYVIDDSIKVADYMAEKVLDPNNDQYIPATTYPNLKPYPTGLTQGVVSVLQPGKPAYNWQVPNFTKPDKRNLLIYELLVRDFVGASNFQTIKDTISYLKRLGINAIQMMPVNEFEGNISWGYNPDFFLAVDKYYGPENALKALVDECHRQGIAVIMDIAMNHSCGLNPMVQMYWNGVANQPAANNPWFNETARHPFNVCYDFNHESQATKNFVDRVIEHWLVDFKVDGFRWDLSKGFTQTNSGSDVSAWSAYDASRIVIWKRIYDKMQQLAPQSYCILEHFADNNEEIVLSNYGMLLWGNLNYNFNEATMGYVSTSNFQYGIFTNRGWTQPNLVTYMESHDEERLQFKNENYGNVSGPYNIKDTTTGLKRNEMAAAFWSMIPAPKMLWQFGELGYDYSINYCQNGTINNSCRTDPKPIRWDYKTKANRMALYNVYSKLLRLRNVRNFLPTFVSTDIQYNLGSGFKWMIVKSDSLKVVVMGNFDVTNQTTAVTFPSAGTWYNYLLGGTYTATGAAQSITLQPGEYYVYVNRADAANLVAALPLKLLSFKGKRTEDNISLTWSTSHEVNVKHFVVERSSNGVEFSDVATVAARNAAGAVSAYDYADRAPLAVKANTRIYYRLRMVDIDGSFSYSGIVAVNPIATANSIFIYPNPVKGSEVYVSMNEPVQSRVQIKIQDASGRMYRAYSTTVSAGNAVAVDVQALPNGVYMLKAETAKGAYVQQLVVQH